MVKIHLYFLVYYIHRLRSKNIIDTWNGAILYIEKYGLRAKERDVSYSKKIFDNSIDEVSILDEHLQEQTLPPQLESFPNKYPCSYCKHKTNCMNAKDGSLPNIYE